MVYKRYRWNSTFGPFPTMKLLCHLYTRRCTFDPANANEINKQWTTTDGKLDSLDFSINYNEFGEQFLVHFFLLVVVCFDRWKLVSFGFNLLVLLSILVKWYNWPQFWRAIDQMYHSAFVALVVNDWKSMCHSENWLHEFANVAHQSDEHIIFRKQRIHTQADEWC